MVKVFDMTAGGTGLTETELRDAGIDFRKVYTHQNGHAAYYPASRRCSSRCCSPPTGEVLGAQVLGWDGVDKRIDVLAVAIRAGMTVYDLEHLELVYAPPYGAAKYPATWPVSWLESAARRHRSLVPGGLPGLRPAGDDPRHPYPASTPPAHPRGGPLPYTELRQRLDEVPRDKPVYMYCRSGSAATSPTAC